MYSDDWEYILYELSMINVANSVLRKNRLIIFVVLFFKYKALIIQLNSLKFDIKQWAEIEKKELYNLLLKQKEIQTKKGLLFYYQVLLDEEKHL